MSEATPAGAHVLPCLIEIKSTHEQLRQQQRAVLPPGTEVALHLRGGAPPAYVYALHLDAGSFVTVLASAVAVAANGRVPQGEGWLALPTSGYVVAVGSPVALPGAEMGRFTP